MGFPATFRTKCQIQVQVQGQARGALSLTRPPLFSGIIAPTSPPGRGPEKTPAPPRRAPQEPPPPAGAAPVPWSRRRRSVPPKDLGARAGVEGGGLRRGVEARYEPVGASPTPQSQRQTVLGRTDARAELPVSERALDPKTAGLASVQRLWILWF
ncbi:uncharacterized protein [Macaca nemestrina]|uniref:uncharacterized protein isoform X1 n=1 Tax=Macaca nemestrina TaxID=9545 RepID=UPI000D2F74D6|nr:uncharacterized protein LOC105488330 isoform X2 [Macaca nemestrina]